MRAYYLDMLAPYLSW